jgi:anti-sigma B factor antagonist
MDDCTFQFEDRHDARILRVSGEVDIYSAPRLETAIATAESDWQESVVVDLRDCRYLDSSALRILVRKYQSLGSRLYLVSGPTSFVRRLFHVAGLDKHFQILNDLDGIVFEDGRARESDLSERA